MGAVDLAEIDAHHLRRELLHAGDGAIGQEGVVAGRAGGLPPGLILPVEPVCAPRRLQPGGVDAAGGPRQPGAALCRGQLGLDRSRGGRRDHEAVHLLGRGARDSRRLDHVGGEALPVAGRRAPARGRQDRRIDERPSGGVGQVAMPADDLEDRRLRRRNGPVEVVPLPVARLDRSVAVRMHHEVLHSHIRQQRAPRRQVVPQPGDPAMLAGRRSPRWIACRRRRQPRAAAALPQRAAFPFPWPRPPVGESTSPGSQAGTGSQAEEIAAVGAMIGHLWACWGGTVQLHALLFCGGGHRVRPDRRTRAAWSAAAPPGAGGRNRPCPCR